VILRRQYVRWLSMLEMRDVSVRELRSFITERGFSHAGLLERHELEARAEEAAAAQASQPPPAADVVCTNLKS